VPHSSETGIANYVSKIGTEHGDRPWGVGKHLEVRPRPPQIQLGRCDLWGHWRGKREEHEDKEEGWRR